MHNLFFSVVNRKSIFCHHTCRFIEFGNDGGPAAKALKPKFNLFIKQVSKNTGLGVPHIDVGMLF
jgi:hypothetical protein